ncbi:MAG: bifunctional diaminohydroxyphosphoribosylaminopyrimidine deaminase/5-amino-6-(5-phosphoribosylamino)uracil reductase RibD [Pseudomonadota bacterium]
MSYDVEYMRSALAIARTGLGRTAPNPSVGCVLVKDDKVIVRARTGDGGRPHAEKFALETVGEQAKGATAYVTLEPCAHEGETPSCAQELIKAGISKVVIALADPDARTNGKGIEMLKQSGVEVVTGILEEEAFRLNEGFFLRQLKGRPFISLKIATTLDGKIATSTGESQWITGKAARARAHLLRAQHDAIAVGVNTIKVDNPSLTTRIEGLDHGPVKIVFDTNLDLDGSEKIFESCHKVIILTSNSKKSITKQNVKVVVVSSSSDGYLNLKESVQAIASEGVTRLMIEGGASLITSFLKEDLFDHFYWFHAPQIIGTDGRDAIQEMNISKIIDQKRLSFVRSMQVDKDRLDIFKRQT